MYKKRAVLCFLLLFSLIFCVAPAAQAVEPLTGVMEIGGITVQGPSAPITDKETVRSVQQALNEAGYACGQADGTINEQTRGAICSYRADRHIGESTDVDNVLLYALGLTDAPLCFPIYNEEDSDAINDAIFGDDGFLTTVMSGLKTIGANFQGLVGAYNYIQWNADEYSVGELVGTDVGRLILVTVYYADGEYSLYSIQDQETGEFYYHQLGSVVAFPQTARTGQDSGTRSASSSGGNSNSGTTYVLNTRSMKFHYPDCASVRKMSPSNRSEFTGSRDEVIRMGYSPCGNCHP